MDPTEDDNESEAGLFQSFNEVIKIGEDGLDNKVPESELLRSLDEAVKLGEALEHQAAKNPNAGRHFPYRFGKGRALSTDSYRKGYFTEKIFNAKVGRKRIDTICKKRNEKYEQEWERPENDTDYVVQGVTTQGKPTEVHVHLVNPTNVTLQGNLNLHNGQRRRATDEPQHRSDMQNLRSDTEKLIKEWTMGMVNTQAAKLIVELVHQGRTWVTVTGGPGEGKTTAAFLALKKLHDMGKNVFYLRHPMDYFAQKSSAGSIIMLDDIFGPSCFSVSNLGLWSHVLNDILALTEHRDSPETRISNKTIRRKKQQQTVILVSRICVLESALNHLGRFSDFMMEPEVLVNLTRMSSSVEERMDIWNCHAKRFRIDVEPNKVHQVCAKSVDGPYGFAHCCKLYASRSLQPLDRSLSMELFFSKPLEFLNQAMKSYMEDKYAGHLLRQMLKKDGKLDLKTVRDEDLRFEYGKVVNRLKGTLLSWENDVIKFNHSSIYDSAAFVLCHTDPQFVLENCPVSFLNERVRLKGNQGNPVGELALTTTLHGNFIHLFLKRLQRELEKNNLSLALCHDSFHDRHFVNKFMSQVLGRVNSEEIRKLFHKHDKDSGKTFLFVASISGSARLLEFICQYVQLSDQEQAEALFGACEHVSVSSLKLLISKFENLNLNATDSHSNTPLLVSATKSSDEMLRLLLERRVNVRIHDQQGNSPLHLVSTAGLDGDASVVKTLVNSGCKVDEDSHSYPSKPLHIACLRGYVNVVRALLSVGANMNTTDLWGATPLHTAASEGHSEVVEALIEGKASINALDTWGDTPLYVASTCGHVNVVQVLLRQGCNVNVRNESRDTALASATLEGHVKVVNVLLKGGADANEVGSSGKTPLQIACEDGNPDLVEPLASRSNINLQTDDGASPLYTATINGYSSAVRILLGKGANFTHRGKWGETLLHVACFSGNIQMVNMFLSRGIKLDVTDNAGDTPLHVASRNGHIDVIRLLLRNRAVVMLKNKDGWTPHDLARQGNHQDACRLLHSQQNSIVR